MAGGCTPHNTARGQLLPSARRKSSRHVQSASQSLNSQVSANGGNLDPSVANEEAVLSPPIFSLFNNLGSLGRPEASSGKSAELELQARVKALSLRLEVVQTQCAALEATIVGTEEDPLLSRLRRFLDAYRAVSNNARGTFAQKVTACEDLADASVDSTNEFGLPPDALFNSSERLRRPGAGMSGRSASGTLGSGKDYQDSGGAGFGGPWLPRSFGTPAFAWAEKSADAQEQLLRPGTEADAEKAEAAAEHYLQVRLALCRKDRQRYFEQYLECRELLVGHTPAESSSSAPASTRGTMDSSRGSFMLAAPSGRSSTPRGLRPRPPAPPTRPLGATNAQRLPQRRPSGAVTARDGRKWTQFWEELTSSDPAILTIGNDGTGMTTGTRTAQRSQGTASARARLSDGLGGSLPEHLEDRALIERQLGFWEHETCGLFEHARNLRRRARALEEELAVRRELDRASWELMTLLVPQTSPAEVAAPSSS